MIEASEPSSVRDVAIPGGWTERDVPVGDRPLRLWLPAEPYEFLNQLDVPDSTALPVMRADPFWAQIWSAAPALVRAISVATWPADARVLELGCGLGVPGLAACVRGYRVTFSDYVPEAVRLVLENARRNALDSLADGRTIDWHAPPDDRFDVILACDVLYERRLHEPLLTTVQRMLAPHGVAWVADPGRALAAEFLESARLAGWQATLFDADSRPTDQPVIGQFRRFELRRPVG